MSSLALNLLLESSQDKGVELDLDISAMEDQVIIQLLHHRILGLSNLNVMQALLAAIEKMSLDAAPRNAKKAGALVSR